MNFSIKTLSLGLCLLGLPISPVQAQDPGTSTTVTNDVKTGPHGGALRQIDKVQVETTVSEKGVRVHLYDAAGDAIDVSSIRGMAIVRTDGRVKRYRYGLMPTNQTELAAWADLRQSTGRQLKIDVQLVGAELSKSGRLSYQEVAVVPLSELQLAAAAIAKQKTCPVTDKPLGSMGDPVAVHVGDKRVFVCCEGCVATVKANPDQYIGGKLEVQVVETSAADAPLIAKQADCPVMDIPLDSMGGPIKLLVGDEPLFLCCKGCLKKVQADPAKYLAMINPDNDQ